MALVPTSQQALSPSAALSSLTAAAANTILQDGLSMEESLFPLPTKRGKDCAAQVRRNVGTSARDLASADPSSVSTQVTQPNLRCCKGPSYKISLTTAAHTSSTSHANCPPPWCDQNLHGSTNATLWLYVRFPPSPPRMGSTADLWDS